MVDSGVQVEETGKNDWRHATAAAAPAVVVLVGVLTIVVGAAATLKLPCTRCPGCSAHGWRFAIGNHWR